MKFTRRGLFGLLGGAATPLDEYEGYDDLWLVGCAHEGGRTTP